MDLGHISSSSRTRRRESSVGFAGVNLENELRPRGTVTVGNSRSSTLRISGCMAEGMPAFRNVRSDCSQWLMGWREGSRMSQVDLSLKAGGLRCKFYVLRESI